jgi:ribosome modulation factor
MEEDDCGYHGGILLFAFIIIGMACFIAVLEGTKNAQIDGRQANYLGRSVEDNPHKDANLAREWREGWIRADKEKGK